MTNIIGLDGKPKKVAQPRTYEIVLNDDKGFLEEEGFLVVTPGFFGISGADDRIKVIVPIESVFYIRETGDAINEDEIEYEFSPEEIPN